MRTPNGLIWPKCVLKRGVPVPLESPCVNWLKVFFGSCHTACLQRLWGNWSSWSVNKLLVSAQRLTRFLPQSKSMHIRPTGSFKWPVWCECRWMFVPLCWPIRWHLSWSLPRFYFFSFFIASYQNVEAFYWCEEQNTKFYHLPQCLTKHSCQSHSEVNKKMSPQPRNANKKTPTSS